MPSDAVNIGPSERRKRRLMGVIALTAGVGTAFMLVVSGAPRWSRLIIFLPIWLAGLGLIQAREKT
jgi:cytochrome c-type biogenesis protein CcmE